MEPTLTISLKQAVELDKKIERYFDSVLTEVSKEVAKAGFEDRVKAYAITGERFAMPRQSDVEMFCQKILAKVIPERKSIIELLTK